MNLEEHAEQYAELERLIEELGIHAPNVRAELRADPDRATRVLAHTLDRGRALHSPASYAIKRFRSGFDPLSSALTFREPLTRDELEGAVDFARRHGVPKDVLLNLELELEHARILEDELPALREEAYKSTPRS